VKTFEVLTIILHLPFAPIHTTFCSIDAGLHPQEQRRANKARKKKTAT